MNLRIFNIAIAIGWLMVLAGGCLISVSWGLVGAGLLLLALTIGGARLAGVYAPQHKGDA